MFTMLSPYIFSLYVVLQFFVANPIALSAITFSKSVILVFCVALIINCTMWLIYRDKHKASLGSFWFLLLFYSYSVFESVSNILIPEKWGANQSEIIFAVTMVLLLLLGLHCLKHINYLLDIAGIFLSVFSITLLFMTLYSLIQYKFAIDYISTAQKEQNSLITIDAKMNQQLPDIYHIVLDGYGRQDVLEEHYDLDNSDFLNNLKSDGFMVRDDCHTNYVWTPCSTTSMLTMNYLSEHDYSYSVARQYLSSKLKQQGVGKILAEYGYTYKEISSPVPTTEHADIMGVYKDGSEIIKYILQKSPFRHALSSKNSITDTNAYDNWRNRILDSLKELDDLPDTTSPPTYVYCHIIMPHPPFVFDAEGRKINPNRPFTTRDCKGFILQGGTMAEYRENYKQQLLFTNEKVCQAINSISQSKRPYLMIITSDHGPRLLMDEKELEGSQFFEALPILMAYKVPVGNEIDMGLVKSPVNLYRVILNHYCGTNYELLPDQIFYSTWSRQLQFT